MTDDDRCPDHYHESLRCQGPPNHPPPHWANTNGNEGVRWGLRDYGCLVGVQVGLVCEVKGPHTVHRGRSGGGAGGRLTWGDEVADDEPDVIEDGFVKHVVRPGPQPEPQCPTNLCSQCRPDDPCLGDMCAVCKNRQ